MDAVLPRRAVVTPRARSADGGEVLPIEDQICGLLRRGVRGVVNLCGRAGSGKTTALAHLAAVLPPDEPVQLFDDVTGVMNLSQIEAVSKHGLVVVTSRETGVASCVARLAMAPWTDDELIEYLLATNRSECQSVLFKVQSYTQHLSLDGSPELWRMVLDTMAADASIPDVGTALRRRLAPLLSDPRLEAADVALTLLRYNLGEHAKIPARLDAAARRLVRHRPVQLLLASELIVRDLCDDVRLSKLEGQLPQDLIVETARLAVHWPAALDRLSAAAAKQNQRDVHPMVVSLLLAMRPDWRPIDMTVPVLSGAYVAGAHWAGVDLHRGNLDKTDLAGADLSNANLCDARACSIVLRSATLQQAKMDGMTAFGGDLAGARLAGASAQHAQLVNVDLHGADLRSINLSCANLTKANLSEAVLTSACLREAVLDHTALEGTDLVGADLTGAILNHVRLCDANLAGTRFRCADLRGCELEGLSLPQGDFGGAKLNGCCLTATVMPGADFRRADLRDTGLAEIQWENADLRDADLRGATFHMGSSRSGLVGSTTPCEGSKTGFYTDDFSDREFKGPEEVRKANLCGADLRGAKLKGVDFYLVDLRGALYSDDQADHFRRCGAILD